MLDRMSKRQRLFAGLATAILICAVLWGLWYLLIGSRHEATDNAYVGGDVALVTPLMAGTVVAVAVGDTERVEAGRVLVRLSDADARIHLAQAIAERAQAERLVRQTLATGEGLRAAITARGADIASAEAELRAAVANHAKAEIDLHRRQALTPSGAVSGDELTIATNGLATAEAALALARAHVAQAQAARQVADRDLDANLALTRNSDVATSPTVLAAGARVADAQLEMDRTVIRAPFAGIVTRRQVQLGQRVAAGATLMTIVPVDQLYVDANFKESQLAHVRIGQPVRLIATLYGGDVVYHGRVAGLAGGTGAAFALIPAQNATGNWIKVTQRLPVRIALDPRELRDHPLRIGLSMDAEIDIGR